LQEALELLWDRPRSEWMSVAVFIMLTYPRNSFMQFWFICSVNSLHYITDVNEGWTGIKLYISLGRSTHTCAPKLLSFRAITSFYEFQMSF
jgi:hypothetical protein